MSRGILLSSGRMTRVPYQMELALLVSVLLHVTGLAFSGHREAVVRLANALRPGRDQFVRAEQPVQTITFVEAPEPAPRREPARIFMETAPHQVTGEEPKEAEFYSDKATVAANPDNPSGKTGETPFLAGQETRVMSTGNIPGPPAASAARPVTAPAPVPPPVPVVPPAPPAPVQPLKPVAERGEKLAKETKPAAATRVASAQPTTTALAPSAVPVPPGPAGTVSIPAAGDGTGGEIASARSRLTASGTQRSGVTAFNVKASPFGAYDLKIVKAVQSRWYALIDKFGVYERAGQVTVYFQLLDDGTIVNLEVKQNTVGEFLAGICQKAIADSAPFDPLPDVLRMLFGKEPRDVNFTFYY